MNKLYGSLTLHTICFEGRRLPNAFIKPEIVEDNYLDGLSNRWRALV